ncbi:MAG: tRNA pseudouridine(38-40) synthase TruA [Bacteroidota bacterium]
MRYFTELAYNGTNYCGWQRQPHSPTVQEKIEVAFSTILRVPITIHGCGRTDTGVHASQYFAHFDFAQVFPNGFIGRVNKFLPKDIVIKRIFEVSPEMSARFDAYHRSYEYHLTFVKNPFELETLFYFPFLRFLDIPKMQLAADLLLDYNEFFPFCKTKSDANNMICDMKRAEWIYDEKASRLVFHISANRFLRGMVRLIVGMCLNVGLGKLTLADVKLALDKQVRLKKDLSVEAKGLFLTEIRYPFLDNKKQ